MFGNSQEIALAEARAAARAAHQARERAERMYDDLLKLYHELRATHDAPVKYNTPAATEQFGPLTRLALAEMARGQSGAVVRSMRDKALAVWVENRENAETQDEVTAIAVRTGEPLG